MRRVLAETAEAGHDRFATFRTHKLSLCSLTLHASRKFT
jgi:hypothetical protein